MSAARTPPTPSSPGPDAPRAVLFDAYGTLFDVHSVAELADELFPGQGQGLSLLWRDKQIEYTRLVTTCNDGAYYRPFSELTRAALVFALRKLVAPQAGDELLEDLAPEIAMLLAQYQHLEPFAENLEVLRQLKARGVRTGILSNGDASMLDAVVQSAGISDLLDAVISVDAVRRFKTHPQAYALGASTLGLPASDILFVSSNAWDALGATWFGYRTLWVNRAGVPFEELGTRPHHSGADLRAVLDVFPALS